MKQRGQELNSFKQPVVKAVNAKDKAALRPYSHIYKNNQHCLWDSQPFVAKTSTQGQPIKDSKVEKPKFRPQDSKDPAR